MTPLELHEELAKQRVAHAVRLAPEPATPEKDRAAPAEAP